MEYTTDRPASARDLPAVAVNLKASSDPGANLIRRSSNIMSSLTLSQSLNLKFFTDDPRRLAELGDLEHNIFSPVFVSPNCTALAY